ncbi:MFS transporter [Labrys okinawensis]|uniref:MFS transporter n=1 Tax=Labrys okinawensis TaxID=346911 RepID=A0A2S9Q4N5_9HYPH|nr:MFS transporter [Labrys okinawensis]PRH84301.1 MFS transporter [Labrys okinawensis]
MDAQVSTGTQAHWREIAVGRYAGATATLCLGVALFAFNSFLVSTALPSAIDELGGASLIAWSVSLYLIFAILGGTIAALLKARYGARAALIGAALLFTAGTLFAGLAPAMAVLLVGRALQGFGEGLIAAICYALIPEIFPSRLVPRVFGAEAMVWATAAFGGPAVAGIISETVSWRAAFLVNVPLSLIFIALVLKVVPHADRQQAAAALPLVQLSAIGAGMAAVMIADMAGAGSGAILLLVLAALLYAGAVYSDRRSPARLFPKDAFRLGQPIGLGLWIVFLMPMAHSAASVYLVYLIQHLWGYGATLAGALNAVMAVCWSLVAIAVASVASQRIRRRLIWLGPLFLVLGLVAIITALWKTDIVLLVGGQVLIGAGFGASWGYLSQGLMEASPVEERNRTSALLPTLQSAAYAIGAAVLGFVANANGAGSATTGPQLQQAMLTVFILAIAIALPGFFAALKLAPQLFREKEEPRECLA